MRALFALACVLALAGDAAAAPSNDVCSDAVELNLDTNPIVVGTTAGASNDNNARNKCDPGGPVRKAVWYQFTGTGDSVAFRVQGLAPSTADPYMYIAEGTCATLSHCLVDDNGFPEGGLDAYKIVPTVPGTVYHIAVADTNQAAALDFTISVTISNDICENATPVDVAGTVQGTTTKQGTNVNVDLDLIPCASPSGVYGVWYGTLNLFDNGNTVYVTASRGNNIAIYVLQGSCQTALQNQCVASAGPGNTVTTNFLADSSKSYYIVVAALNDASESTFTLTVLQEPNEIGGNDPHIFGFNGQSFYFEGRHHDKFYALLHDRDLSINARTAPRYTDQLMAYADIVSLGMSLRQGPTHHEVAIFSAEDACRMVPSTCGKIPPYGVAVIVDSVAISNGYYPFGSDFEIAIMNVPHVCKRDRDASDRAYGMYNSDGGEARSVSAADTQRRLSSAPKTRQAAPAAEQTVLAKPAVSNDVPVVRLRGSAGAELISISREGDKAAELAKWLSSSPSIGGAPSAHNDWTNECEEWLRGRDLFEPRLDGLMTTIMVRTPQTTMRVEHWGFDVDATGEAVPLMVGISLGGWRPSDTAHGVAGQTIRPLAPGASPLEGHEDDYVVDEPFATTFKYWP